MDLRTDTPLKFAAGMQGRSDAVDLTAAEVEALDKSLIEQVTKNPKVIWNRQYKLLSFIQEELARIHDAREPVAILARSGRVSALVATACETVGDAADLDPGYPAAVRAVAAGHSLLSPAMASRLLDDLPVSVDRSLVPAGLVPSANEVDFTSASLYAVLESHGHGPRRTEYIVGAIAADAASAALLEVPEGSPLLATHTKAFDAQGRLVEVGDMVYRGDRYQFHASLTKDPG